MSLSYFFPRSSFKISSRYLAQTLLISFKKTIKNYPVKFCSASKLCLQKMSLKNQLFLLKSFDQNHG